jgi:biotin synthase-related radical SAM superfamily protein
LDNNNYVLDRMKHFLFLVLLIAVLSGCKRGIPSDLIQPAEMGQILYEIHIVDGLIGSITEPDSARRLAAAYYKGIYKKYDVDSALYAKSMSFYYDHPVVMTKMYQGVVSKLEREKKKIETVDSLKQVAIANLAKAKIVRDSMNRILLVDTTKKDSIKLDTIKIDTVKMSKKRVLTLRLKNDSIKVKIDSAKKEAIRKKLFFIHPRRTYWGK